MSWIKTISYKEAEGPLKRMYERVKGLDNNVDNVLSIHSLRPHTLKGHMTLYKNVLHNSNNTLPKWYLETLGVYVSHLNQTSLIVKIDTGRKHQIRKHLAGVGFPIVGDDFSTS